MTIENLLAALVAVELSLLTVQVFQFRRMLAIDRREQADRDDDRRLMDERHEWAREAAIRDRQWWNERWTPKVVVNESESPDA